VAGPGVWAGPGAGLGVEIGPWGCRGLGLMKRERLIEWGGIGVCREGCLSGQRSCSLIIVAEDVEEDKILDQSTFELK
jgi:hypothetical protein